MEMDIVMSEMILVIVSVMNFKVEQLVSLWEILCMIDGLPNVK